MRPIPFGKYMLRQRIAVGGMAELYKATHPSGLGFERPVAIKCILPELAADREFVKMLIDEAKIASVLSHPSIASIYDLGCEGGRYYIVMEYVHGRDLRQIAERQGARGELLPMAVTCHVMMKSCEALHHAHTADRGGKPLGIIHRDISPQNILVSFEGDVKVIDFGLAKAAGRAVQTAAGIVKGKLAYMSPEQARGKQIDHRSDIYSLGICFFELLTGRRLFFRGADVDTIIAVQKGIVPSIRAIDPSIPEELEAIVKRALSAKVGERYQRAQDLHDDLETFVYGTGRHIGTEEMAVYMRELFPDEAADVGNTSSEVQMPEGGSSGGLSAPRIDPVESESGIVESDSLADAAELVESGSDNGVVVPPPFEPDPLPWEDPAFDHRELETPLQRPTAISAKSPDDSESLAAIPSVLPDEDDDLTANESARPSEDPKELSLPDATSLPDDELPQTRRPPSKETKHLLGDDEGDDSTEHSPPQNAPPPSEGSAKAPLDTVPAAIHEQKTAESKLDEIDGHTSKTTLPNTPRES